MRGKRKSASAEPGPQGGVRKGGGRKLAGKKAGAVVTKRIVLRGRQGSSKSAEAANPAPQPDAAEASDAEEQQQQQQQQRQQQPDRGGGPATRRRSLPQQQQQPAAPTSRSKRRSAAGAWGCAAREETIESLSTEALQEVFLHLSRAEQQSYCREVLPLVCKRFRDVLAEPSSVWESLHIDFIQKGQDLAFPELWLSHTGDGDDDIAGAANGSNRRLLHSAVERWLKPRAAAVKRLVLSFSARDQTHSFPKSGHGLRRLLRLLAPTLQEISIAHCSDIFHARSFDDLAMLQNLESLAVTFMTGRVLAADLAPLEELKRLRSLTLAANRQSEEAGQHCLAGFPDPLLRLKGLTSLAVSSLGVTALPAGITKLKGLACLDVSGCPLAFLPSSLWKLSGLRHVRLNGTALMVGLGHTWEPLAKLPALESVELRDTKAMSLPPALTGLSALTALDLSDNPLDGMPGLQEDPLESLRCLPNLQRLRLRCCQLPSVPASLSEASRLTHLDLSRNQLVELPPGLSTLQALRELVAEGNCFPRIPQVLAELPALETADLSFNIYMEAAASLQPLAADGGLARLQHLDLRKMLGVWKQSSIKWLRGLVQELEQRHLESGGSPGSKPVVLWD